MFVFVSSECVHSGLPNSKETHVQSLKFQCGWFVRSRIEKREDGSTVYVIAKMDLAHNHICNKNPLVYQYHTRRLHFDSSWQYDSFRTKLKRAGQEAEMRNYTKVDGKYVLDSTNPIVVRTETGEVLPPQSTKRPHDGTPGGPNKRGKQGGSG